MSMLSSLYISCWTFAGCSFVVLWMDGMILWTEAGSEDTLNGYLLKWSTSIATPNGIMYTTNRKRKENPCEQQVSRFFANLASRSKQSGSWHWRWTKVAMHYPSIPECKVWMTMVARQPTSWTLKHLRNPAPRSKSIWCSFPARPLSACS